jgi:hypothetical protein
MSLFNAGGEGKEDELEPTLVRDENVLRSSMHVGLAWPLASVKFSDVSRYRLTRRKLTYIVDPEEPVIIVQSTKASAYIDEEVEPAVGYEYILYGWTSAGRWEEIGVIEQHTWQTPGHVDAPMVDYGSVENVYKRAVQSFRVDGWYREEYGQILKSEKDPTKIDQHPPVTILLLGDSGCGKSAFINSVWSAVVDMAMRDGPAIVGTDRVKKAPKKQKTKKIMGKLVPDHNADDDSGRCTLSTIAIKLNDHPDLGPTFTKNKVTPRFLDTFGLDMHHYTQGELKYLLEGKIGDKYHLDLQHEFATGEKRLTYLRDDPRVCSGPTFNNRPHVALFFVDASTDFVVEVVEPEGFLSESDDDDNAPRNSRFRKVGHGVVAAKALSAFGSRRRSSVKTVKSKTLVNPVEAALQEMQEQMRLEEREKLIREGKIKVKEDTESEEEELVEGPTPELKVVLKEETRLKMHILRDMAEERKVEVAIVLSKIDLVEFPLAERPDQAWGSEHVLHMMHAIVEAYDRDRMGEPFSVTIADVYPFVNYRETSTPNRMVDACLCNILHGAFKKLKNTMRAEKDYLDPESAFNRAKRERAAQEKMYGAAAMQKRIDDKHKAAEWKDEELGMSGDEDEKEQESEEEEEEGGREEDKYFVEEAKEEGKGEEKEERKEEERAPVVRKAVNIVGGEHRNKSGKLREPVKKFRETKLYHVIIKGTADYEGTGEDFVQIPGKYLRHMPYVEEDYGKEAAGEMKNALAIGRNMIAHKAWTGALKRFQFVVDRMPTWALARLLLAYVEIKCDNPLDSVKHMKEALHSEPHNKLVREWYHYCEEELKANPFAYLQIMDPGSVKDMLISVMAAEMKGEPKYECEMDRQDIGPVGAKQILGMIRINGYIHEANLNCNKLGDEGMVYAAEMIAANPPLETLTLRFNQIGNKGAELIAGALKYNSTLVSLSLHWNEIKHKGGKMLARALTPTDEDEDEGEDNYYGNNRSLDTLLLGANTIGPHGTNAFATMLYSNTTLTMLHLDDNNIGDDGAAALAAALRVNCTLIDLNVDWNSISSEGAQGLADMLEVNEGLTSLSVYGNQIDNQAARRFERALESNPRLLILRLLDVRLEEEMRFRTRE